jgi:hypothetical protein
MKWYRKLPARWKAEKDVARAFLKDVKFDFDEQRRATIEGIFAPITEHGSEIGAYKIRIVYPSAFPNRGTVPSVYLVSHRDRWENGKDSHIEEDWKLCVYVPAESEIDFSNPQSLRDLLLCLATFFFKEKIYQRDLILESITGKRAEWPGEARAHGVDGIFEAIREKQGRDWGAFCLCGSGKKFEECCLAKKINEPRERQPEIINDHTISRFRWRASLTNGATKLFNR